MSPRPPTSSLLSHRRAFTLIELLVVIAVIGLLISILLPALSHAREVGRQTVCFSNLRQIAIATNTYANDNKELVFPQFEWAPVRYTIVPGGVRRGAGLMYQYVDNFDRINECPTGKRRNLDGSDRINEFGGYTGVSFDYTMFGRMQGARLGMATVTAMLKTPGSYAQGAKPPTRLTNNDLLTPLTGTPIFVEESLYFHNNGITDGLWGNADQVAQRHFRTGNTAYLEGHAGIFKVSSGESEQLHERNDFDVNDIYVTAPTASAWIRLEPTNTDNSRNWSERPFGWVNRPR